MHETAHLPIIARAVDLPRASRIFRRCRLWLAVRQRRSPPPRGRCPTAPSPSRSPARPTASPSRTRSGRVVLATRPAAARGDGYGSVGWTSGRVFLDNIVDAGYYAFDTALDPWRDALRVTDASDLAGDSVDPDARRRQRRLRTCDAYAARQRAARRSARRPRRACKPRAWEAAFATPRRRGIPRLRRALRPRRPARPARSTPGPKRAGSPRARDAGASATNPWPNGETMTYYPVPFFLSTAGYGFWLDSTWRNQFDLATDRADAWRAWRHRPDAGVRDLRARRRRRAPVAAAAHRPVHRRDRPADDPAGVELRPAPPHQPRRDGRTACPRCRRCATTISPSPSPTTPTHFSPDGGDIGHEADAARVGHSRRIALGYKMLGYYNPYFSTDRRIRRSRQKCRRRSQQLAPRERRRHAVRRSGSSAASRSTSTPSTSPSPTPAPGSPACSSARSTSATRAGCTTSASTCSRTWSHVERHDRRAAPQPVSRALRQGRARRARAAATRRLVLLRRARGYTGSQQYAPMVWSRRSRRLVRRRRGAAAQVRAGITASMSGVAHWGSDIGGFKCLSRRRRRRRRRAARALDRGRLDVVEHARRGRVLRRRRPQGHHLDLARRAGGVEAPTRGCTRACCPISSRSRSRRTRPARRWCAARGSMHPERRELAPVDDAFYFGPSLLRRRWWRAARATSTITLPPGLLRRLARRHARRRRRRRRTVTCRRRSTSCRCCSSTARSCRCSIRPSTRSRRRPTRRWSGPTDVADVYDVVGVISTATGARTLHARRRRRRSPRATRRQRSPPCADCTLHARSARALQRAAGRSARGDVDAGGLHLSSTGGDAPPALGFVYCRLMRDARSAPAATRIPRGRAASIRRICRRKKFLPFYASRFSTVEINNTFYRMPSAKLVQSWADEVPDGFTFAIKAPQRITHHKRLKECERAARGAVAKPSSRSARSSGRSCFSCRRTSRRTCRGCTAFLAALPTALPRHVRVPPRELVRRRHLRGAARAPASRCASPRTRSSSTPLVATANWGYLRLRREDYRQKPISANGETRYRRRSGTARSSTSSTRTKAKGPCISPRY